MDDIVQIERNRYSKICGERRLFHDVINIYPEKSKNLTLERSLCVLLFLCFFSEAAKLFSKVSISKFYKKHPRWISVLVAEYGHHIWIAQHVVLGILKQIFLGISSIYCCLRNLLFYLLLFFKFIQNYYFMVSFR